MIKKIIKLILLILMVLILIIGGYFLFMTVTDYVPDESVILNIENNNQEKFDIFKEYSIMSFNIGYCGLDRYQDFFMDGGTMSRSSSEAKTIENLENISKYIYENKTDFILLQEVDIDSTRSFNINQYSKISNILNEYNRSFAYNYKVPWVPVPLSEPHGKVNSGLATFTNYNVDSVIRYDYPGKEAWPKQLAMLDRCFVETRYSLSDSKELVILNSHLSAYDKGGFIRTQQINYLKNYLTIEEEKGNYIIVGGDWNQLFPEISDKTFDNSDPVPLWLEKIPNDFTLDGFKWGYDISYPTDRAVDSKYIEGKTYLTIIDGFLVSPNIEILSVKTSQLEFEFSDHNPVIMNFKLN